MPSSVLRGLARLAGDGGGDEDESLRSISLLLLIASGFVVETRSCLTIRILSLGMEPRLIVKGGLPDSSSASPRRLPDEEVEEEVAEHEGGAGALGRPALKQSTLHTYVDRGPDELAFFHCLAPPLLLRAYQTPKDTRLMVGTIPRKIM
jgi:hypothetical protein